MWRIVKTEVCKNKDWERRRDHLRKQQRCRKWHAATSQDRKCLILRRIWRFVEMQVKARIENSATFGHTDCQRSWHRIQT